MSVEVPMTSFVLIRHKVRNFEEWKRGYAALLPKLQLLGLTEKHLLRNASDGNEVVLLLEATDLTKARAFAESSALREAREKVGILDEPDIYFLNG
jgi:hypothetical protein